MKKTMFYQRFGGGTLTETLNDGVWSMEYAEKGNVTTLEMYDVNNLHPVVEKNLWNGMTAKELLANGRDILAEEMLKNGDPDYAEVAKLLPRFSNGYAFLSGITSWGGVAINRNTGDIIPQECGFERKPAPMFSPAKIDPENCGETPVICLLGKELPVMILVYENGENINEFLYFAEAGDPDRDPIIWIRRKQYLRSTPEAFEVSYELAAWSRLTVNKTTTEDLLLEALADTVAFWIKFRAKGTQFDIPNKELEHVVNGTQIANATTFSADHPHYGHLIYAEEVHDHFPPNYMWALELYIAMGRNKAARGMWRHMLDYSLTDEGRFVYRQGEIEWMGASAVEYGHLLFLADRYKTTLQAEKWDEEDWEKIMGMGNVLLSRCLPCKEADGRILVIMCAEADTNTRIFAYVNNNLWAIRGLNCLANLLNWAGKSELAKPYADMAALLTENMNAMLEKESVKNTRFGELPPFCFGYTATPATLSMCRDTFEPMTDEEHAEYMRFTGMRDPVRKAQDLTENTYANYRYYPEMLSAMMLPAKHEDAIVKMREAIGGELLGMIRYMRWVDNWPVVHYARFLLETNRIEKYLLLLYAHTLHHGEPDLMCYYEQVQIDGIYRAPDCVPSLLTTPMMVTWAMAYETMNGNTVSLLRGVPKEWFAKGFSAKGLCLAENAVDIAVKDDTVSVSFRRPTAETVELVWRAKDTIAAEDILSGIEYVEEIRGNVIVLKKGITTAELKIR